jgi:hypothetical protein
MNCIRGFVSELKRKAVLAGLAALASIVTSAFCQSPASSPFPTPIGPPPKFTSVPPIEDPELYYQFYQYHLGLINTNNAAKAADPAKGVMLDQQMAALLNVDVKELPTVITNTLQVTAAHASIAARKAAGPDKSSPLTPAQQALQLDFQKVHATASAVGALWQGLTPASWTGIHGYIVGPFKAQFYKKP